MVMNKKSVVFTLISTVLLSVILISFLIQTNNRANVEVQKANVEVETLNSFTKTLNEKYLPTALKLSAIQATRSINDYIEDNGIYLDVENLNDTYDELMKMGQYVEGGAGLGLVIDSDYMYYGGVNYTIGALFEEVDNLAGLTGINFTYGDINPIKVYHEEPFTFTASVIIDYNVSSNDQKTSFSYSNKEVKGKVPLYELRDPMRIIGLSTNVSIIKAEHDVWDTEALEYDIINITYIDSDEAPSFLQRLTGDFSSSEYGITSFVNTKIYSNPNLYTNVDYSYFTQDKDNNCRITELSDYPNFYLRTSHRNKYGLDDCTFDELFEG